MIKNKELFSDLDEGFLADVCNANSSRSEIRGRGTVRCFVKDNTGRSCLLETKGCLLGTIQREESGVGQAIDGQGGNDPVQ